VKDLLRTLIAAAVGAVVALAVVVGQPALAGQVEKAAAKNSVTSKSIKDGTIKKKDLNAEVTGPLAKADSALQSVPDNSVITSKLANNAVTNPKIADNAVTGAKVADNSLRLSDLVVATGTVSLDPPTLAFHQCASLDGVATGQVVTNSILLVSQPAGVAGGLTVQIRENSSSTSQIDIVLCNPTISAGFDPPARTYRWAVIGN